MKIVSLAVVLIMVTLCEMEILCFSGFSVSKSNNSPSSTGDAYYETKKFFPMTEKLFNFVFMGIIVNSNSGLYARILVV